MGMREELVERNCLNKKGSSFKVKKARLESQMSLALDELPNVSKIFSPTSVVSGNSSSIESSSPKEVTFEPLLNSADMFLKQIHCLPFGLKVIDSSIYPLLNYSITLEATLNDGVKRDELISSRMFRRLMAKTPDKLELSLEPPTTRNRRDLTNVTISNLDRCTKVTMENVTPDLVEGVQQLLDISPIIDDLMAINCTLLGKNDCGNDRKISFQLSIHIESTIDRIRAALEAHPMFQSLPMTDQIILVKEAATETVAISSLFVYDRSQGYAFSFPCLEVSW
jgi:hypothetical protein